MIRKIGRGKYSEVFEGINVKTNKLCVIKVRRTETRTYMRYTLFCMPSLVLHAELLTGNKRRGCWSSVFWSLQRLTLLALSFALVCPLCFGLVV